MLANRTEVDEAMIMNATSMPKSSAILFDFAAAFPSVEHEFLHDLFKHLGWPDWLLNFIKILYQCIWCHIVLGGARFEGFEITRGVRQGYPLSPPLFTISRDLILQRLHPLCPDACIRAYADDLAIVLPNGIASCSLLEDLFHGYATISGLKLNIDKTVCIPLFHFQVERLREQRSMAAPTWAGMLVKDTAKYLGMYIGPGRGQSSWKTPLEKYIAGAKHLGFSIPF